MQVPIDSILQKEMTRKEFIATMGLVVATALGFSGLVKMLTGKSLQMPDSSQNLFGYGSSPYGR